MAAVGITKKRYFVSEKRRLDDVKDIDGKFASDKKDNIGHDDDDTTIKFPKVADDSNQTVGAKNDPYPGPAPLPAERTENHKRGIANSTEISDRKMRRKVSRQEKVFEDAINQAARHDIFQLEDAGYIETDDSQKSYTIKQSEIKQNVDIASSRKTFELNLNQFGPYQIKYSRNGKHLLLGGRRGHVAAFEWFSKKLMCEINVMETVNDISWLHTENMYAVAQKKWTYIYDNQGTEYHCLKSVNRALRLDFLPYHYLLVASTANGFLNYIDISIGKEVASVRTKSNRLNVMTQNPHNAITLLGHHNGTVSMWNPNMKEPLVKMLCHRNAIRAIAVDRGGLYMATSGQDGHMRIFDVRTYKPVHSYKVMRSPCNLQFSQRGLLAATFNTIVEVYKDPCREVQEEPYLIHKLRQPAESIQFCPYEDVLGVGRADGFESLLIPGAGEPNYDSLESNPHQSKSQRREWVVKSLLEKIQPDMITLDPFHIGAMDKVTAEQLQKEKEEKFGKKTEITKSEMKYKAKGKSSSVNIEKRKQLRKTSEMRAKIKQDLEDKRKALENSSALPEDSLPKSALDRFRKKK